MITKISVDRHSEVRGWCRAKGRLSIETDNNQFVPIWMETHAPETYQEAAYINSVLTELAAFQP